MRVNILSDSNWESKLEHATRVLDCRALGGDYGPGLNAIVIVLMCRDPELGHKQRVRLRHAEATLYIDVMLDLPFFVAATHAQRRARIASEVVAQVSEVLGKRRISGFDASMFLDHLATHLLEQLNGEGSTRFDEFCLERATGF